LVAIEKFAPFGATAAQVLAGVLIASGGALVLAGL
jgi:hypothetical protein